MLREARDILRAIEEDGRNEIMYAIRLEAQYQIDVVTIRQLKCGVDEVPRRIWLASSWSDGAIEGLGRKEAGLPTALTP